MLTLQHFALVFFLLFSASCRNESKEPNEIRSDTVQTIGKVSNTANPAKTARTKFSSVEQVISDTSGVYWGNYSDNLTSILHFDKKGFVNIEYYGQCWYTYPITIFNKDEGGSRIVMRWDDVMDCKFDIGFNKPRNNVPKPTKRSLFATFKLQNDTLFATYLYPEWVKEMNKTDTSLLLFPESFAAKAL